MRRIAIALTLLAGCFEEPDTDDHVVVTTVPMTTSAEESSSSSDGASSSSEESSTGDTFDPKACPEWCNNGCETVSGIYLLCRCTNDLECLEGTSCDRPGEETGFCR